MSDSIFSQTLTKLIDSLIAAGNYDALIQILSLLCLFSISNSNFSAAAEGSRPPSAIENPLSKMLGDFAKGGAPDMISTLLPLLNNPQLKSRLNPSSLSSIMGMINNLSGQMKTIPAAKTAAPDNTAKPAPFSVQTAIQPSPDAEKQPAPKAPPPKDISPEAGEKAAARHLNWKTSF